MVDGTGKAEASITNRLKRNGGIGHSSPEALERALAKTLNESLKKKNGEGSSGSVATVGGKTHAALEVPGSLRHRKREVKDRTVADLAREAHASAVSFDNGFRNRKAHASALHANPLVAATIKLFKDQ